MSYLQQMSWFDNMQRYDERTVALLIELSNPQYKSRKLRSLYNILKLDSYILQSVIKNLASEGIVYMKTDRSGDVVVGLVEKNDIIPSILIQHRVNGRTVNSIVFEATTKDNTGLMSDYINKVTQKRLEHHEILDIIDSNYYSWEINGEEHELEISDTTLVPS